MLKLVFPSYEKLTERYIGASKKPKYFLPVAWVKLWYYRIFIYKENSFKRVVQGLKSSSNVTEHNSLLKILKLD